MSVSPAQNFSKPPPVPDWPTVIFTSGFSSLKSSAAAWANGKTVEEPSMAMLPFRLPSAAALPEPPERLVVAAAGGDAEAERRRWTARR